MNVEKDQIPIEIAIETQKTGWYVPTPPLLGTMILTDQETKHISLHNRGKGNPQQIPRNSPRQENRPPLPARPRSHSPKSEGCNHQRRSGRNSQTIQEEGITPYPFICLRQ